MGREKRERERWCVSRGCLGGGGCLSGERARGERGGYTISSGPVLSPLPCGAHEESWRSCYGYGGFVETTSLTGGTEVFVGPTCL